MNCRNAQRLIFAERDGALATSERAALETHIAGCANCRTAQASLTGAINAWRISVSGVVVPDEERAWQDLRREIRSAQPPAQAGLPGWLRWTIPLGAAAALMFALTSLTNRAGSGNAPAGVADRQMAHADFVEVPSDTSSMVYVDDQSGWLVVWAVAGQQG